MDHDFRETQSNLQADVLYGSNHEANLDRSDLNSIVRRILVGYDQWKNDERRTSRRWATRYPPRVEVGG